VTTWAGGLHPGQRSFPALGPIRYNERRNVATTTANPTRIPMPLGRRKHHQKEYSPWTPSSSLHLRIAILTPSVVGKQHALAASISSLVNTTLGERRSCTSKQPALKTKKIVSKMLAICSLFQPVEHKKHQANNRRQKPKK